MLLIKTRKILRGKIYEMCIFEPSSDQKKRVYQEALIIQLRLRI